MKEDILEQLVEDWLISREGWFVKHNLKFRPLKTHAAYDSKRDSVHSDIDILAVAANQTGKERVAVVTCKSWQTGFLVKGWHKALNFDAAYNERSVAFKPREKWKYFRELTSPKWIEAFILAVERETLQRDFVYYVVVTKLMGTDEDKALFENSLIIKQRFERFHAHVDIRIITVADILRDYIERLKRKETTALEATDVGRLLQLIVAAGINIGGSNLSGINELANK